MHLYSLWNKVFNIIHKLQYGLYPYAVVCVDVYSRYVKARSIPNRERESMAIAIFHLNTIMGRPNIIYWHRGRFQSIHNTPVNTPASMKSRSTTPTLFMTHTLSNPSVFSLTSILNHKKINIKTYN
jgi:hypothetical protein